MTAPVAILGAGWSGLAAAMTLCEAGVPVQVFEVARQAGGRARAVTIHGEHFDNGQHVLLGAYTETLDLLDRLGTRGRLKNISRLCLHYRSTAGTTCRLRAAHLPAPLHLGVGLLATSLLSFRDRLRALALARKLHQRHYTLDTDMPLARFLTDQGQSPRLIERLWEPLCLAALNTPIMRASARVFLRVLQESFGRNATFSRVLVPTLDLSRLFARPAVHFIEKRSGIVHFGERVTRWHGSQGNFQVVTGSGSHAASHIICALPHRAAARLLNGTESLRPLAARIGALEDSPITTVYLDYGPDQQLDHDFFGVLDGTGHWAFDRGRLLGEAGRMALVVSADSGHAERSPDALAALLADEMHRLSRRRLPAQALRTQVLREKQATFLATPEAESLRPETQTPVAGFYLAGDYVQNGLPGTLEGAVRNGRRAANQILHNIHATKD